MIGFLVSQRGIELTHKKSKAITKMSAPKTEKEARVSLAASITLAVSLPIDRQLRAFIQSTQKEWADSLEQRFPNCFREDPNVLVEHSYLSSPGAQSSFPNVLGSPRDFYSCVLGQHDESSKKEQSILSKKFADYESRCSTLEQTYCALVWETHRLRYYMLSHTALFSLQDGPVKVLAWKTWVFKKIGKMASFISWIKISYVTHKSVKDKQLLII